MRVYDFVCSSFLKHFSFQVEMSEMLLQMCTIYRVKYRCYCQILMKPEFSWQIFRGEKLDYLISWKFVQWEGRADRHDVANKRCLQLCQRAQ